MTDAVTHHADSVTHHAIPDAAEKASNRRKQVRETERQSDGKMRVTSGSWDGEKVILRDQVLEVRNVDGRLHVARKERRPDEWDPPITQ